MDTELKYINKKIKDKQNSIKRLKKRKKVIIGEMHVACANCNETTQAKDMTIYKHKYYVDFHSYKGDYWCSTDLNKSWICSHCSTRNRLFGDRESSIYHVIKDSVKEEVYTYGEDDTETMKFKGFINTYE